MPINPLNIPYPDFKIHEVIDPEQFDLNNERIVDKVNEVITEHESSKGNLQTQINTTNALIATRASQSVSRDNNLQAQITTNSTQIHQNRLNWLPFVNTIAQRDAITSPKIADAVYVRDTNRLYRYSGTAWVAIEDTSNTVVNAVDLRLSARLNKLALDVTDFGAVGDGVTDDSRAIQAAIAALPQVGGTLVFPDGGVFLLGDGIMDPVNGTGISYPIEGGGSNDPDRTTDVEVGRDIRLKFHNMKNVTLIGYGATLLSHPDNGETKRNAILDFENCFGVAIFGLTVDGNKNARQPIVNDWGDGNGWNGRGNIAFSDCNSVLIQDVASVNSMMDGIAFGGMSGETIKYIYLKNTICDNAYRNGLTLSTTKFVRIENCSFTNTGKTYGTAPKIGADIEADYGGTLNEKVVFSDCYFADNVAAGLAFAVGSANCHVIRCTFDGKGQYPTFGFSADRWGYNYVKDCRYIDCGLPTEVRGVYLEDNVFEFNPVVGAGQDGVVNIVHLQGPDVDSSANVYIRNNTFLINLDDVSPSANSLDFGRFWLDQRTNAFIENNKFINFMSVNSSWFIFNLGSGGSVFRNNDLIFQDAKYPAFLPLMSSYYLLTDFTSLPAKLNRFSGNTHKGYPKEFSLYFNQSEHASLMDGPTYQKSISLPANSVTKIDPSLLGGQGILYTSYHMLIELFYGPMHVVLKVNSSWGSGTELVYYSGTQPTFDLSDINVTFYQDGPVVYIDLQGSNTVCRVTFCMATSSDISGIDHDRNIFALASSADVVGLTPITPTCKVKEFATLAETTGLKFNVGHTFYVESENQTYIETSSGGAVPVINIAPDPVEYNPVYQKSIVLPSSSITKIDPLLLGGEAISFTSYHMLVEIFYGPVKIELKMNVSWAGGVEVVYYSGTQPTSDYSDIEIFFYQNGPAIYVDRQGANTICRVTLCMATSSDAYALDQSLNIFAPAVAGDISGLTAITPTCKVTRLPDTASLSGLSFPNGHSVYITALNKPLWWNGTNWLDATGTIVV